MVRRSIAILIVILLLAGLIGYSRYRPVPDRVSGLIEADEIRVGSRVGGRVSAVMVEEGDRVAEEQVLVELEPFDLLEREQEARNTLRSRAADLRRLKSGLRPEEIAQAKAQYEQYQARLDLLKAGPRAEEIESARARVNVAQGELTFFKQNFERTAELLKTGATTSEEYDAASEKLQTAQSMLIVRQEELKLLELGNREEEIREMQARVKEAEEAWILAQKGYREEEIEQALAARDAAQAALDVILQQEKELTIRSPVNGVIEALDLQKGDLVPAGAPALSILNDKRLWVRAYVPQNRVGLHIGQKLSVTVDALNSQRIIGEVIYISRQAEFTPNNVQTREERAKQVFRIKVALENQELALRPGMTVDVWLEPVSES